MGRVALLIVPALVLPSLAQQEKEPATMSEHFGQTLAIQQAVVEGDLEAARSAAKWMAEHESAKEFPASSERYLKTVMKAAKTVAEASDLDRAAAAVAEMGYACGGCHRSLEEGSSFSMSESKAGDMSHMKGHEWAVEQLWKGLVGPSDEAWLEGCSGLAESPLRPTLLPQAHPAAAQAEELDARISSLEKLVHELSVKAGEITDAEERAHAYGGLLATCADCHTMVHAFE
jgi:cytochrome c556